MLYLIGAHWAKSKGRTAADNNPLGLRRWSTPKAGLGGNNHGLYWADFSRLSGCVEQNRQLLLMAAMNVFYAE
tara:strand:+ start:3310 stop:3528 length:219 start_codon:yes stop_codon:yes gene_type:complete